MPTGIPKLMVASSLPHTSICCTFQSLCQPLSPSHLLPNPNFLQVMGSFRQSLTRLITLLFCYTLLSSLCPPSLPISLDLFVSLSVSLSFPSPSLSLPHFLALLFSLLCSYSLLASSSLLAMFSLCHSLFWFLSDISGCSLSHIYNKNLPLW